MIHSSISDVLLLLYHEAFRIFSSPSSRERARTLPTLNHTIPSLSSPSSNSCPSYIATVRGARSSQRKSTPRAKMHIRETGLASVSKDTTAAPSKITLDCGEWMDASGDCGHLVRALACVRACLCAVCVPSTGCFLLD